MNEYFLHYLSVLSLNRDMKNYIVRSGEYIMYIINYIFIIIL